MAHLEHRKLNDPPSNKIMEQLGFVNLADCNEGFSTWNIYPAGKVSLPLTAIIINWKDLLPFIIKQNFERGKYEGECTAYEKINKVLKETIFGAVEIKNNFY